MKLIGMLGGLGWEATSRYYRMINEYTQKQLGEQHTARILLHTVDHAAIKYHNSRGDLNAVVTLLADAARSLKNGGADFIIVANNAMHEFAAQIEEASGIDLLHISDPTGKEIRDAGYSRVALLGTRTTMEGDFLFRPRPAHLRRRRHHAGPRRPDRNQPHHLRRTVARRASLQHQQLF
jgi:aspartate racemase